MINGPKMGLRCGTQRAAELRARGSIGPRRLGYASCGWIRGPTGPGLFLRMRIVWRGQFCTVGCLQTLDLAENRTCVRCRSHKMWTGVCVLFKRRVAIKKRFSNAGPLPRPIAPHPWVSHRPEGTPGQLYRGYQANWPVCASVPFDLPALYVRSLGPPKVGQ